MDASTDKLRLQKKIEQLPEKTQKLFRSMKNGGYISPILEEAILEMKSNQIHDALVYSAKDRLESINNGKDPEDYYNPYAEMIALDRARKEGINPFEEVERLDKIAKQMVKKLEEKGYNCGKNDNPQPDGTVGNSNVYSQGADFIMRIALPSSKPMEVLEKLDSYNKEKHLPFAHTKRAVLEIFRKLKMEGKTEEEITNSLISGVLDAEIEKRVNELNQMELESEKLIEPMVRREIKRLYKKEYDGWRVWGHDIDELCDMIIVRCIDEFNHYNRSTERVAKRLLNAVKEMKEKGYDIHIIKEAIQKNPENPVKEAFYISRK